MNYDLLMPKLGLTMTEGSVSEWQVVPGDRITVGQVLLVIETDKVSYDVASEKDGTLLDIAVPEGETVPVGTVLAHIELAKSIAPSSGVDATGTMEPTAALAVATPAPATLPTAQAAASALPASSERIIATPLARQRATAAGVSLRNISGSGPGGRVKAADVEAAARAGSSTTSAFPGTVTASRRRPTLMQSAIARRLSESKHGVPHFYLATEAEVTALELRRAALNVGRGDAKLTVTPFIVAAVARALADIPEANTVWIDGELVTYAVTDVSLAVHTPRGLYAPVLRDAGTQSLTALARASGALAARARNGELSAAEMAGSAITVSNAGMHNVTYMASIIAPGQSSILGVASIRKVFRPDSDARPTLRQELGLVLAADHRVFDGVSALQFLNRIIGYLEAPDRLPDA